MNSSLETKVSDCRNIWQYVPNEEPRIKFYSVPSAYDDQSIRHADLIGSYHGFKNDEVWFTMKGKRLFRAQDDNSFPTPPTKYSAEVEMMTPEELKQVLEDYPSYEQLLAEYMDLYAKREAYKKAGGQVEKCEVHQACANKINEQ